MKILIAVIIVLSMVSVGWAATPCCLPIEKECRRLAQEEQGIYGLVFPSKIRSQYLEETAYQECLNERCRNCFSVGDASGATIYLTASDSSGIYQVVPAHRMTISNPQGKSSNIDFSGDKVTYTGDLPVDEAAKVLFDNVGALCKGSKYQTTKKTITKWTTTSRTISVYQDRAIINYPICNQTGQKYEVTYAQIQWKGKQIEFELERKPIEHEPLYRAVTCEDSRWPRNSTFELNWR